MYIGYIAFNIIISIDIQNIFPKYVGMNSVTFPINREGMTICKGIDYLISGDKTLGNSSLKNFQKTPSPNNTDSWTRQI